MAGPATKDLSLYQGDDYELLLKLFEADGTTPKDLTGLVPAAQIRVKPEAVDILASFAVLMPAPTNGQITLKLTGAQTAALLSKRALAWDFQLTELTGRVRTYLKGDVTVGAQVTR